MTSVNITNEIKKILREKYNIQNITTARIKSNYKSTDDFYKYLYELYIREKDEELEKLKQKEIVETELKEKLDKLKQKNKLKKLKYKLNKKKKLNNDLHDNISEYDDVNSTILNQDFNSVNDLNDGKNDFLCNDTDNDENNDKDNNSTNLDDNNSTDEPYNRSTDDSSSDENENNCIETYNNDTTIELKNDLYIYFSNELIKNNNNVYLLYLIELLKNFYKNNYNYRNFIEKNNYIKLEIVKDIHSYNNEHFNGIFYNTIKQKSGTLHFYTKNDQITKMSFVTFI
jgi:hypothetical protein